MPDVIAVKGLELLKDALTGLTRVGVLWYADDLGSSIVAKELDAAKCTPPAHLRQFPMRGPEDLPEIFDAAAKNRSEAMS